MPIDTKQLISQQFTRLLRQKGLDKVTVKELVDACGISRQAFYYHFQDILDVMRWGTQQKVRRILSASLSSDSLEEALLVYITFFGSDRTEIQQLLSSRYHRQVYDMLHLSIRDYLSELLRRSGKPLALSYADLEASLDFYAGGICQSLLARAGSSEAGDILLAKQLGRILRGELLLLS